MSTPQNIDVPHELMPPDDLKALVVNHPAFKETNLIGTPGFSMPDIPEPVMIDVTQESVRNLASLGIQFADNFVSGNRVIIDLGMQKINLKVNFYSKSGNTLVIGKDSKLQGSLRFESDNNIFVAGSAARSVGLVAMFRYSSAGLFLGNGGSAPTTNFWIEGPEKAIIVGDDFMFAWDIWLRSSDSHALIDLESGKKINGSQNVVVGPHVWLGQDVIVMPEAKIGGGSVIGARSVVTREIPACSVAVGTPARVVRSGASWTRHPDPAPDRIALLQEMAREFLR